MRLSYTSTLRIGMAALLALLGGVVVSAVNTTYRASNSVGKDFELAHRREHHFIAIADEFADGGSQFLLDVSTGQRNEDKIVGHLDSVRQHLRELDKMSLSPTEREHRNVLAREERRFRTAAYSYWVNDADDKSHDYGMRAMEEVQNAISDSIAWASHYRDLTDASTRQKRLEVKESLDRSTAVLLVGGGGAILAGLAVVIYLTQGLTRPIRRILSATEALAGGDLDHRLNWSGSDPMVKLACGIDRMADRISISSRELDRARERAEQAASAKSDFLANMSHEIRTPMTAILGFAEQLSHPEMTADDRSDAVETIVRNGHHLLGIINSILDLSKIEAGRMQVESISCSPSRLAADVISLMRVRADDKKIDLALDFATAIPKTIKTDPIRLRQILINLLGNSVKFTESGSVGLTVSIVADENGSHLLFDVRDSGIGMTEEQIAILFQPFAQADASMSRRFGGTGLGLTISKRFAEMLGGDIEVIDSKLGRGTHIRASVATGSLSGVEMLADPRLESQEPRVVVQEPTKAKSLEGCRVLLAEDGLDNQRFIKFVLEKAGADVTVVENGEDAVNEAMASLKNGEPYDVVLMDMQMPVMDGYTATSVLRDKSYGGPIIALTAHAMAGDRDRCLAAGCDDYATKPVDRAKLIEAMVSCMASVHANR